MRDLMIDIETLGNRPGSVILSIGAVAFDANSGQMGEEFYAAINAETATAAGLTTDVSTMIWWMKQSDEARRAAFSGDHSIGWALGEFGEFARRAEPSRIWAKPPSFDLVLLEAAFRACSVPVPWHFRVHRDCRTIFDLTGTLQPDIGTAHNALDDAKAQAFGVIAAYAKLRQIQPPEPKTAAARFQHREGGTYEALGIAKMQTALWMEPGIYPAPGPVDMREVMVYRAEKDGSLWVRPIEEFNYRFTELAASTSLEPISEVMHADDCPWDKTRLTLQRHCTCGAAAAEIEQLQMDVAIFNGHRHELLEQIDIAQLSNEPTLELTEAQVSAVLHLVESRLAIVWAKVSAREAFANELRVLEPASDDDAGECCVACEVAFDDGDLVYWCSDDTGHLHADCCGPERECYTNADGNPLKDGESIPQPFAWRADR